ncbi:MAG: phosphomethylpyrimidine synthase ThiC [Methanotrichaceae archaeon]
MFSFFAQIVKKALNSLNYHNILRVREIKGIYGKLSFKNTEGNNMNNIYNVESYRREITSKICAVLAENGKNYLQIADNNYYPQGGAQKGDPGQVIIGEKTFNIKKSIKDNASHDTFLLVDEPVSNELVKKTARCVLNWDSRYKQGADIIDDPSLSRNIYKIQSALLEEIECPLAKVSIYQTYIETKKDKSNYFDPKKAIEIFERQATVGFDIINVHATIVREDLSCIAASRRLMPLQVLEV